jgi:diacylglycerol kinase (ATP)
VKGAALIVNARSRTGEKAFDRASRLLSSLGVHVGTSYALSDPTRLAETVRKSILEGHDPIILGGGDGSVSSTVDFLANHHATLGLLPLGTANDFARTLQIPPGLEEACETIARGKVVDVDLGLVEENFYVNVSSVGLGVEVTRSLSPS